MDSETEKHLAVLYLDFSKAFDKVCNERLLENLARRGVGGNFLKLLHSYFVWFELFKPINAAYFVRPYSEITNGV